MPEEEFANNFFLVFEEEQKYLYLPSIVRETQGWALACSSAKVHGWNNILIAVICEDLGEQRMLALRVYNAAQHHK